MLICVAAGKELQFYRAQLTSELILCLFGAAQRFEMNNYASLKPQTAF